MKSSKTATTFARRTFLNKILLDKPGKAKPVSYRQTNSVDYSSAAHEPVGFEAARGFDQIPGPKGLPVVGSWLDYKLSKFYVTTVLQQGNVFLPGGKEKHI